MRDVRNRKAVRGPTRRRPVVLCAGIGVVDFIFRVDGFPTLTTKSPAREFLITGGGCAANAAITIARLGGEARFAGPLGDDEHAKRVEEGLIQAGVHTGAITRVRGATTSVSGIFIDAAGERLLTTRRSHGLASARPRRPDRLLRNVDVLLADNHFPGYVVPICAAARARGLPVVLDVDKPAELDDPLLALGSHVIFSAEALRAATGITRLETALARAAEHCRGFVAVTNGEHGVFWRRGSARGHQAACTVTAVDTLAAGDVFHAAFSLALAEGHGEDEVMRFASAAAALKCTRFGGIVGAPTRAEVEQLLKGQTAKRGAMPFTPRQRRDAP
jgi:sulfofructose kinase